MSTTDGAKASEAGVKTDHVDTTQEHFAQLQNQEEHEMSVMTAIKKNPWTVAWCVYAVWCLILASFEGMAGGVVFGIPQFRKDFGYEFNGEYVLEGQWQSAIDGAPRAALAISTLLSAWLADKIGRKYMLLIAFAISYVGITLEVVATSLVVFFVGKMLTGFAIGAYFSVGVCYVGEIAPLALRGVMTAFCALGFVIGPFVGALIMNYTSATDTRWAYRAIFCSQYGFLVIATVFWPFMPESPSWLLCQNKEEAAAKALRRLGATDDEGVKRIANIKATLAQVEEETKGATYLECFKLTNLRRTIISIAPMAILAFSGVSFIGGYFTFYAQLAGYNAADSFRLQVIQQTVSLIGNVMSWFLIDRVGRRSLTLWGLVGLLIQLCITGGLATRTEVPAVKGVVALELIFVWYYNVTVGATAYAVLAEASTSRLRAKTVAIGVALQSSLFTMFGFVLPYLFNPDQANLGAKTAFVFGGLLLVSTVFIWFYLPETAGRTYEELDEMFLKKIPARDFKNYQTEAESKGKEARRQEDKEQNANENAQ